MAADAAGPATAPEAAALIVANDLTQRMTRYLDRHMILPILDFLQKRRVYDPSDMDRAKMEVLSRTNMVDFAMDIYKSLHSTDQVPPNLTDRREQVVANMASLEAEVAPILELVKDVARVAELQREHCFTQAYLASELSITPQHIAVLHRYAKFVYDCGDYAAASNLLVHFRQLTTDTEASFSALWGKLGAAVVGQSWDDALEAMLALKEAIEARTHTPAAMQLQQRVWLMHWSLFLMGNHPNGRAIVADLMLQVTSLHFTSLRFTSLRFTYFSLHLLFTSLHLTSPHLTP